MRCASGHRFTLLRALPRRVVLLARRSALIATIGMVSTTGTGCLVMQKDYDALSARTAEAEKQAGQARADSAAIRADLEATRQRLDNALRANADSSTDLMSSKARLNDLAGRVDETQHGIEELKREVNASRTEIYARLDDLKRAQQYAQPESPENQKVSAML